MFTRVHVVYRQFAFVSLFAAFILTCLNFENLFADNVYTYTNETKNVAINDIIEIHRLAK